MKIYQAILRGPESTCRGVRYRILPASEVDKVTLDAASNVEAGLTGQPAQMAFLSANRTLGVRRMLVAYTKAAVKPTGKDPKTGKDVFPPLSDDALWTKVDAGVYASFAEYWDTLFSASDDAMLGALYTRGHALTQGAVEDILGEVLEVATD